MGLRSRKQGEAGEEARARKFDREGQMLANADAPLHRMQNNTEAFNILWRDFLLKITMALVAYSLLAAYQHSADTDHSATDLLSACYYVCSSVWLRGVKDSNYNILNFFGNRMFCTSLALFISQLVFLAYHHNERNGDLHHEFFPTTMVHLPMVLAMLAYMRNNVSEIKENREVLSNLMEKLQKD